MFPSGSSYSVGGAAALWNCDWKNNMQVLHITSVTLVCLALPLSPAHAAPPFEHLPAQPRPVLQQVHTASALNCRGRSPAASDVRAGIPHCNTRRTGYTPRKLTPPYGVAWTHAARHKPRPAWKEPGWEPQRIDFDYAYAVSGQDDTVYYASSSDHALHTLDLVTGRRKGDRRIY